MKNVSIVLPVFVNSVDLAEMNAACLDTLVRNTNANAYELIIVDGASTMGAGLMQARVP